MSYRIQRVSIMLLLAFALIALMAGYWQVLRADDLTVNRTVNGGRLFREEERIERGRILDRNGRVLAEEHTLDDGARVRRYPEPGAAPVVGYHSPRYGDGGMEAAGNRVLSGETGFSATRGFVADLLHLPRRGGDLRLTLDIDVQRAALQAMHGQPGAAVALDPRTGDVLAMVSNPTFDPNTLDQNWQALVTDPDQPLLNRATQGLYVPGSTFKTVTLAAVLAAGLVTKDTPITCPEEMKIGNYTVTSHNEPPGRHTQNIQDAYAYSCNTAFAQLGLTAGRERLVNMAEALGITAAPPFDLPTVPGQLANTPDYLVGPGLAATAFGQGELLVTPLHLALIAATVANQGLVPVPRLVDSGPPRTWRRAMEGTTARETAEIMAYAGRVGWGSQALAIPGVSVAGKTGSAEVDTGLQSHAVFIAFAPVESPRVAVAVLGEQSGAGSAFAAPVARAIIAAALHVGS